MLQAALAEQLCASLAPILLPNCLPSHCCDKPICVFHPSSRTCILSSFLSGTFIYPSRQHVFPTWLPAFCLLLHVYIKVLPSQYPTSEQPQWCFGVGSAGTSLWVLDMVLHIYYGMAQLIFRYGRQAQTARQTGTDTLEEECLARPPPPPSSSLPICTMPIASPTPHCALREAGLLCLLCCIHASCIFSHCYGDMDTACFCFLSILSLPACVCSYLGTLSS